MMVLLLAACAPPEPAADLFQEGLDPLEAMRADAPVGDETWPETLSLVSGDDGGVHWTHARGYVLTDLATTLPAVQNPDAGVDRRRVASWEVTANTEPEYPVSYAVHIVVEDLVTVEYDVGWRHGEVEADVWGTRFAKTAGDNLIATLEGSVLTLEVAEGVSEVQFIYHLEAVMTSTTDTEQYLSDFYTSVRALAHGENLPTYEE